jgi:U32 family peptidase
MKQIELITFAKDKHSAALAIDAGATHLILEDSKVCIRSYSDDFNSDDFSKLAELAQFIRNLSPTINITANCDLLFHERHLDRLRLFISSVKAAHISNIRIQDFGLIPLIKEIYPDASVHLNPEIGNHNQKACDYFSTLTQRQVISNELTSDEIKHLTSTVKSDFELQVQGPILIQYSNRRYMSGLGHDSKTDSIEALPPVIRNAQDQDYKKRLYRFYDNAHGHMMFLYFDRCLIRYIPELVDTGCTSWLIDGRGESDLYLKTSLSLYKQERDRYLKNTETYVKDKEAYTSIQAVADRAQKAGFFRANMTDQSRKSYNIIPPDNTVYAGKIIDLKKESFVTIECEVPLTLGDSLLYNNPKKEEIPYTLTQMKNMGLEDISSSEGEPIVLIKWQKGMASKSKIFKKTRESHV